MSQTEYDLYVPLLFAKGTKGIMPVLGISLVPEGDASLPPTILEPLETLDRTAGVGLSLFLPQYARKERYRAAYVHPPSDADEDLDKSEDLDKAIEGFSHLLMVLLGFYALGADKVMNRSVFRKCLAGWTASSYPDKSGQLQSVRQLREKLWAVFEGNDELIRTRREPVRNVLLSTADKGQVAAMLGISPEQLEQEVEFSASQLPKNPFDPLDADHHGQQKIRLVFASSFQQALDVVFGQELLSAYRHRLKLSKFSVPVGVGLLVIVAILVSWLLVAGPRPEPQSLDFKGSEVNVLSKGGKNCWSIRVDGRVSSAVLAKLYTDKPNYLVVGVTMTKPEAADNDVGKVMVFDPAGRLVWATQTSEKYPYGGGADNRMFVGDVIVTDPGKDGTPKIVAISCDFGWYPCKISVLDRTGRIIRRYWHPGHLVKLLAIDSSASPRQRIVAWGCNNDMVATEPGAVPGYFHGIVCIDPETMDGEAPPRRGGLGHGTELWYGLLLPQDARIENVYVRPIDPGAPAGAGQTMRVSVTTGVSLYLDENGTCVEKVLHDTRTDQADNTTIKLIRQAGR